VITYRTGNDLDLDEFIDVYRNCSLGPRRPVDDRERMRKMLATANLVVTAWDGDRMVGVARSVTDFCYCTYLSDLAVRESHQRLGIGKELIRRTQDEGGLETRLILLAAPAAVDYYPHIGFEQHHSCWMLPPGVRLP
jgi:GNAT superfamily N-acetyltransferase